MKKVPNIISTKDLDYLADIFNWNFTCSKKALMFSKKTKNENVTDYCEKVAKLTSKNCHTIINILEESHE